MPIHTYLIIEFESTRSPGPSTPRALSSFDSFGLCRSVYSVLIKVRLMVKDTWKDNPQECSWLDHSLSLQNVPRYQPIAAILDCKPMPSKNVGHRGNINAPVSPFFLSFPPSPLILPPQSLFFLVFYSVSHSRARRLTYLAADRSGVLVQLFG